MVNTRRQLEDNAVAGSAARLRRSIQRPRLVADEPGSRDGTVAAPRKVPQCGQHLIGQPEDSSAAPKKLVVPESVFLREGLSLPSPPSTSRPSWRCVSIEMRRLHASTANRYCRPRL